MTTSAAVTQYYWGDDIGTKENSSALMHSEGFGLHNRNGTNGIDGARTNCR